ncbi:hypothetical protein [Pedobacter sp. UYP30]|uniref:hypothetical protein n=1 Tax=Pedobacter sp. UYP30 TaxID=1756400 RepID=UPI0033958DEA
MTQRYEILSMDDPNINNDTNYLLVPKKCNFNIEFQNISEYELQNGHISGNISLNITEFNNIEPILQGGFYYQEQIPATESHLKTHRYMTVFDRNLHFITVWSTRQNNYCEMFINDYSNRTLERFIP